jgi:hypothetical protein
MHCFIRNPKKNCDKRVKGKQRSGIPLDLRKLNNERKRCNFTFEKDYDIPTELQITNENNKFLQYDSETKDENRILIFKTDDNLKYLLYSRVLVCDGTVKSPPTSFEQLFTIQTKIRNIYLPLLYCFMKHRNHNSYIKMLDWIDSKNYVL